MPKTPNELALELTALLNEIHALTPEEQANLAINGLPILKVITDNFVATDEDRPHSIELHEAQDDPHPQYQLKGSGRAVRFINQSDSPYTVSELDEILIVDPQDIPPDFALGGVEIYLPLALEAAGKRVDIIRLPTTSDPVTIYPSLNSNPRDRIELLVQAQVEQVTVVDNSDFLFSVKINETEFTYQGASNTIEEIRDALIAAITGGSEPVTVDPVSTDSFTITADDPTVPFILVVGDALETLTIAPAVLPYVLDETTTDRVGLLSDSISAWNIQRYLEGQAGDDVIGNYPDRLLVKKITAAGVRTITTDYTITDQDFVIRANTGGGNIVVAMPPATSKQVLYFNKVHGSNTLSFDLAGADTINGLPGYSLTGFYEYLMLIPDGVNGWQIYSHGIDIGPPIHNHDILSLLGYSGNPDEYLAGDATWRPLPGAGSGYPAEYGFTGAF